MWLGIHNLLSPKRFFTLSNKLMPWLSLACLATLTYGLIGGLFLAPADYLQGDGF